MYWYPQALFTAEQACRRRFCFLRKATRLFPNMSVFDTNMHFYGYLVFMHIFGNTKWTRNE